MECRLDWDDMTNAQRNRFVEVAAALLPNRLSWEYCSKRDDQLSELGDAWEDKLTNNEKLALELALGAVLYATEDALDTEFFGQSRRRRRYRK